MNLVVGVGVWLAALSCVVQAAQVYVKFLTPPHGYTHNLRLDAREGVAVAKEERHYPSKPLRYQPQAARTFGIPPTYFYPRPAKPFDEYGIAPRYQPQYQGDQMFTPPPHPGFPSGRFSGGAGPPPEPYLPTGEYINPAAMGLSQHQSEVTYDPLLITGPQAAQYVSYLFSRGELFFHLIPHERLVLMNQRDRVANNLLPHLLASIRPGHPFFIHR